jgi:hypothetical protein
MTSRKALFFLRHYNDIDHIVPVIWKLRTITDIPVAVVLSGNKEILDDYRIQFIQDLDGVDISLLDDFMTEDELEQKGKLDKARRTNRLINKLPVYHPRRILRKIRNTIFGMPVLIDPESVSDQIANRILKNTMQDIDNGVVIFDWISDNMVHYLKFAEQICGLARKLGYTTISLPHGDEPHFCKMIRRDELNYDSTDIYSRAKDLFDFVVVPNQLCAERYLPHMESKRIPVLGSPRFNDEWIIHLHNMIPAYKVSGTNDKIKIVFFLRHFLYPLFWDEIVRTLDLITQFPNVYLIVVHHTRGENLNDLTKQYPGLGPRREGNLEIVARDVHSSALLQWADIVLDVGTSIVFEAVKMNKPVLELEYLHATYTTISHYMKGTVMLCRDHLYNTINIFSNHADFQFYDELKRGNFIKEVIDGRDSDVLNRYVSFLVSQL